MRLTFSPRNVARRDAVGTRYGPSLVLTMIGVSGQPKLTDPAIELGEGRASCGTAARMAAWVSLKGDISCSASRSRTNRSNRQGRRYATMRIPCGIAYSGDAFGSDDILV
jgi:hypothetical protein